MNYYNDNAESLFNSYQAVSTRNVHRSWLDLLSENAGTICDIGAGSGRDAAWFAKRGWDVTAVEPCANLRKLGVLFTSEDLEVRNRPNWIDDSLPHLLKLVVSKKQYDIILLSAVWMHLPPSLYCSTLNVLRSLLKKKGLLVISIRNGPDPEQRFFESSFSELVEVAAKCSLVLARKTMNQEDTSRPDISWDTAVFTKEVADYCQGERL